MSDLLKVGVKVWVGVSSAHKFNEQEYWILGSLTVAAQMVHISLGHPAVIT